MFGFFIRQLERGKFLCNKMAELVTKVEDGFSFDMYTERSNCRTPGPLIYMCQCALKSKVYNNSYILIQLENHVPCHVTIFGIKQFPNKRIYNYYSIVLL